LATKQRAHSLKPRGKGKRRKKPSPKPKKKSRAPAPSSPQSIPSLGKLFAAPSKGIKVQEELAKLPAPFRKLYKDEFSSYTKGQREFLQRHLAQIGAITQRYLYLRGYPEVAIKTRQQGTALVEFILHPNGDITKLRLLDSSGYSALDRNSIEVIRHAYKDYPLPPEPTKVRIYIEYRLVL